MNFNAFKKTKSITALLCLFLAAGSFSLHTLAVETEPLSESEVVTENSSESESDTVYHENNDWLTKRTTELSALIDYSTPTNRNVNKYILYYVQKLNNIDEASLRVPGYKSVIELYYTQGMASCEVARIYYTYIGDFKNMDSARRILDDTHGYFNEDANKITGGLQEEIASAQNIHELNNSLYARMYYAIFEQKLNALLQPADSEAVRTLVTAAYEELKLVEDLSSGKEFEAIYERTKKAVLIQRDKEQAVKELTDVFSVLYADNQKGATAAIDAASQKLSAIAVKNEKEVDSVREEINQIMATAITEVLTALSEGKGDYIKAYLSSLSTMVIEKQNESNTNQAVLSFSPLLADYALTKAKAEAKDAIVADLVDRSYAADEEMVALLAAYNGEDGVIELCADQAQVAFEQNRAMLRVELYGAYLDAVEKITAYGGEESLPGAKTAYEYAKLNLMQVDFDSDNAAAACKNAFDEGKNALQELVVKAEVTNYEKKYGEIIAKDPTQVTAADQQALTDAINDLQRLSDGAKAALEEKKLPGDLASKYKTLIKAALEAALGKDTEHRREALDVLTQEVDKLTASGKVNNLPALVAAAEQALARALAADRVLDRYDEITSSENYIKISEANKQVIKDAAEDALRTLISDKLTDQEALLQKAAEYASQLSRDEAVGLIEAAAEQAGDLTDNAKVAVDAMIRKAKEQLEALESKEEISKFTEEILFGIEKEQKISDLEKQTEQLISRIEALDMFSETDRKEYIDALEAELAKQSAVLRDAKDADGLTAAIAEAGQKLKKVTEDASVRNEELRVAEKEERKQALKDLHAETLDRIEKLGFLNKEEKDALKKQADEALEAGLAAIDKAHLSTEIEKASADSEKSVTDLETKGTVENQAAEKKQKDEKKQVLTAQYEQILNGIEKLTFLNKEEKEALTQEAEKALKDQLAKLDNSQSTADLETAMTAAKAAVSAVGQKSIAADEEAEAVQKEEKKQSLQALYQTTLEAIDAMTFLDDTDRLALKKKAEQALESGLAKVEEAESTAALEELLRGFTSDLSELEQESLSQNELAGEVKKADANIQLSNAANVAKETIKSFAYVADEDKSRYIEEINIALESFSDSLPSVAEGPALEEAAQATSDVITAILEEGKEKNLNNAKLAAIADITQMHFDHMEELERYWFANSNDMAHEKALADEALEHASEAIHAGIALEEVMSAREGARAAFDALAEEAKASEDKRCVDTLIPVVAGLGIACGVELLAFAVLTLLNKRQAAQKGKLSCYMPITALTFMASLMMPVGLAWSLTVLLALADLILGGVIVYLVVKLIRNRVKDNAVVWPEDEDYEAYDEEERSSAAVFEEAIEEVDGELLEDESSESKVPAAVKQAEKPAVLPSKKSALQLKAKATWMRLTSPAPKLTIQPKQQLIYLLPPAMPDPLPVVTADQADLMISNEDAFCPQETNIVNTEVYTGKRKASINIDKIGRNFKTGDLVSLNTLKEKGLISQKVGHVKILGRGMLDKPLIVMAQNFSASAVKMIVLTGGSAILVEGARK